MIADYEFNIEEKILRRGRAEGRAESLFRIVEARFGRPVADELASVLGGLPDDLAADEVLATAAVCESGKALLSRARVLAATAPHAS